MRFEKITISNYRQYENLEIEFKKNLETDLHIIIASNGIGKTNLLNAIDWCLYGDETHLGDSNAVLPIASLEAIDTATSNGISVVNVSVKIQATEDDKFILFERNVDVNVNTQIAGVPKFQVSITPKSGNTEILTGDEAVLTVDTYLPRKIKQYFFFDGEQLYNYFDKNTDSSHVKDSIHEIAQINVVSGVKDHLNVTINEKQRRISSLNPGIKQLQTEIDNLKEEYDNTGKNIKNLEQQIKDAEDKIDELTQKISGLEYIAEDDRRYRKNQEDIQNFVSQQNLVKNDLLKLIKKYYVLLSLYNVNNRTSLFIQNKEAEGCLPPDINRNLIIQSLANKKCAICQQDIGENVLKHLEDLLQKFQVSTSVSNKLMEIKNDVNKACRDVKNYDKEKNEIYRKMREYDKKISELEEINEEIYKRIKSCSSIPNIQDEIDQREQLKIARTTNLESTGSYKKVLKELEEKIKLKESQLENENKKEKQCGDLKLQISYIKKAFEVVKEIETEIIGEIREKMEKETFEVFSNLIWKKNTYGRIELNDDYKLRLFHVHGESCLGSCSAAERELLALAFTLALHKISHHDSLLFIDTPVGRVSDENREAFAKSLITVSETKQLILAFTPSEYSEEISKYFNNNYSSCNHLNTSDEKTTKLRGVENVR